MGVRSATALRSTTLHEFLTARRQHIVALTRRKLAARTAPRPTAGERAQELRTLKRCVDEPTGAGWGSG